MESLPNELLLHILSLVRDGRTLLDSVPLVCKRWHAFSKDRRAWSGVDIEFLDDADVARMLLHAPAARSLHVHGHGAANEARRRMTSALRRSRVVLGHGLSVTEEGWECVGSAGRRAITRLLHRHGQTAALRSLDIFVPPNAGYAGRRKKRVSLLDAIAAQRHLVTLRVQMCGDGLHTYRGQLAGALCWLQELRICADLFDNHDAVNPFSPPDVPTALVMDLVSASTGSLCVFELDMCPDLERFQQVADKLIHVNDLTLRVYVDDEPGDGVDEEPDENVDDELPDGLDRHQRDVLCALSDALSDCVGMRALEVLRISMHFGEYKGNELEDVSRLIAEDFSAARPDVEVGFCLEGIRYDSDYGDAPPRGALSHHVFLPY